MTAAVARVQRRVDEALETAGVSGHWFAVLYELMRAEGHRMPMSRLAREVSMTTGGFTKLADRMAREGLIDRRGSSDDRRVVHAALTDAGRELTERAAAVYEQALRSSVLESVSPDGLAGITRVMRDIARGVEEPAAGEFVADDPSAVQPPPRRRSDDRS